MQFSRYSCVRLPCTMPFVSLTTLDNAPLILVCCVRHDRKFYVQLSRLPDMPYAVSFAINFVWLTLDNVKILGKVYISNQLNSSVKQSMIRKAARADMLLYNMYTQIMC